MTITSLMSDIHEQQWRRGHTALHNNTSTQMRDRTNELQWRKVSYKVRLPGKFWRYFWAQHSTAWLLSIRTPFREQAFGCLSLGWQTWWGSNSSFLQDGIVMLLFRCPSDPFIAVRSQRNLLWFETSFVCVPRESRRITIDQTCASHPTQIFSLRLVRMRR